MIAAAKALVLAFALGGLFSAGAVATGTVDIPLEQARLIHEDHLGANSTLPDAATNGQQTALDHIVANQEKWVAEHPLGHDDNETDDDVDEVEIDED
ncbi:MAG TPA: hypothetical protein VGB78_12075 [Thermoplasmata archaeon]|jgi:hypothetical protein